MSLKFSLIATAIWMVLIFVVAFAIGYFFIQGNPIPGVSMEERGTKLGVGMGTLAGIGLGAIWLPFAARLGKERREAMERAKRTKKKSRR